MMAFQHEPDHQDKPDKLTDRCDRCHNVFFVGAVKNTSEGDPYCPTCGFVFGTSVAPASWVCEDCAEVVLDHGGEDRPWCENCKLPMSCIQATASSVHGAGLGETLDLGLTLLMEDDPAACREFLFTISDQDDGWSASEIDKIEQDMLELGQSLLLEAQAQD